MRGLPTRVVAAAVLLAALLLGGIVSFYASPAPDGLTRVAEDKGIAETQKEHGAKDSPLAGYELHGVDDARLSGGLAGVVGVVAVLVLGSGLTMALRRRTGSATQPEPEPAEPA